jgi:hypothetical protein
MSPAIATPKHFGKCIIWKSASASLHFPWVLVILLNLLSFNAVFEFWEKERSHVALKLVSKERFELHLFCFQRDSKHLSSLINSDNFCFRGHISCTRSKCSSVLRVDERPECWTTSTEVTPNFELGKPIKNVCFSHFLLSKSYSQHLENIRTLFLQFRE